MSLSRIDLQKLKIWHIILTIIIVGFIAYGKSALTHTIFHDEWAIINRIAFTGTVVCPRADPDFFLRPLASCWSSLLFHLFGVNIVAYHLATIAVVILRSIVLYFLLELLFPKWRLFNFACALLFLVFPNVYYHVIFESGYHPVAHILFFLTCILLLKFFRGSRWWTYFLALVLLIVSLMIYETHMGLMLLVSGLLFLVYRGQLIVRHLAQLGPGLIIIFFGIGRWWTQLHIGSYFGHSVESASLSPGLMIRRVIAGYMTSLSAGTANAFLEVLRQDNYSQGRVVLLLGAVFTAVFIIVAILIVKKYGPSGDDDQNNGIPDKLTEQLLIIGFGLLVIGAGYIPFVTAIGPSLAFLRSRINLLPSIGAAIVILTLFSMAPTLLGWKGRKATVVFLAMVIPFLLMSIATQRSIQIEGEKAWEQHKIIWQELFVLAPDIASDTHVFLEMPSERPMGSWPFHNALAVLYAHNDIVGQIVVGDYDSLKFTDEGVYNNLDYLIPYDQAMLLTYDDKNDRLNFIQAIPGIDFLTAKELQCSNCILDDQIRLDEWRELVQK